MRGEVCVCWGGGGSLNDFKFGTFIGRFPSDCLASMAVKGLILPASSHTPLPIERKTAIRVFFS